MLALPWVELSLAGARCPRVQILLYVFVAIAGALTSVEAGSNAKLTQVFGNPWWPALLFSLASLALLAIPALFLAGPLPTGRLGQVPWWGWVGGVISALYIFSMLIAPGRLGSGLFTGLTVSAAVITSIALDHYGLVGFKQHSAGIGRLIGASLMVVGLICVAIF